MDTGSATEQMVVNYESQCKLCLIAKTYYSYAPKDYKSRCVPQQGLELCRVRSTSSYNSLFLSWTNECPIMKPIYICTTTTCLIGWCNLFQLHSIPHFVIIECVRVGFFKELLLVKQKNLAVKKQFGLPMAVYTMLCNGRLSYVVDW